MHKSCTQTIDDDDNKIYNKKQVKRIFYNSTLTYTDSEYPFNNVATTAPVQAAYLTKLTTIESREQQTNDDINKLKVNLSLYKQRIQNQCGKCMEYIKELPKSNSSSGCILKEVVLENMDKNSKSNLLKCINDMGLNIKEEYGKNETVIAVDISPIKRNKEDLDRFLTFIDKVKECRQKRAKKMMKPDECVDKNIERVVAVKKEHTDVVKSGENRVEVASYCLQESLAPTTVASTEAVRTKHPNANTLKNLFRSVIPNSSLKPVKNKTKENRKTFFKTFKGFFFNNNHTGKVKMYTENDEHGGRLQRKIFLYPAEVVRDNKNSSNGGEVNNNGNKLSEKNIKFNPSVEVAQSTALSDERLPHVDAAAAAELQADDEEYWENMSGASVVQEPPYEVWGRKVKSESQKEIKIILNKNSNNSTVEMEKNGEKDAQGMKWRIEEADSRDKASYIVDDRMQKRDDAMERAKLVDLQQILNEQKAIKELIAQCQTSLTQKNERMCEPCGFNEMDCHGGCETTSDQWSSDRATISRDYDRMPYLDTNFHDSMMNVPKSLCWCQELCEKLITLCTKTKIEKNLENELQCQRRELNRLNKLLDAHLRQYERNHS